MIGLCAYEPKEMSLRQPPRWGISRHTFCRWKEQYGVFPFDLRSDALARIRQISGILKDPQVARRLGAGASLLRDPEGVCRAATADRLVNHRL
jgi:hypothetical protein